MNGHWLFPEQMGRGDKIGFVYLMREPGSGIYYIGKKNYRVSKGPKKGSSSDWRTYQSSSTGVKTLISELGTDLFHCIVLDEYSQKASLRYAESWSLWAVDAPCNDRCLNVRIEEIRWKIKEPPTDRHKERLKLAINGGNFYEDFEGGLFVPPGVGYG